MTAAEKLKIIMGNPILWGETFCKIINKQGKKVPFILNPQQKELVQKLEKYNIILKSRQLGITSVSCMESLHHAITQPSSHCMLISYSMDSANAIFDKLKQMYDDLPSAIKPKELANNRSCLKFSNGSKITVCTMGSKELGRGSSLTYCHISELAFAKQDTVTKQLLALEQAMLPDGKIVIESTANGLNEFYDLWTKSENGENLYKPFFFSWIDDKIMFAEECKEFTNRYKALNGSLLTVEQLDPQEQIYYSNGASREQLMWRRLKIANSSEMKFKQEFPASPIEAFITTGNNIFRADKVQEQYNARKSIQRLTEVNSIPTNLKPYIRSYLTVYDVPVSGKRYYVGVDGAEGIGADYSVIEVYDEDGIEVAQFRSNKIQPYVIAEISNELGLYYNRALLIVENASSGGVILDRLKNVHHYQNIYRHKDFDARGKVKKKLGFKTSSKSKPLLIQDFVEMWENDDIFIKSQSTLNEMKTYVFDGTSMNATRSSHDDTVIATALAIHGLLHGINYKW